VPDGSGSAGANEQSLPTRMRSTATRVANTRKNSVVVKDRVLIANGRVLIKPRDVGHLRRDIAQGCPIPSGRDAMEASDEIWKCVAAASEKTAVNFAPAAVFEMVPHAFRILAADGIVVGAVAAVLLNLVLPDHD
jgi:hypothetical protein